MKVKFTPASTLRPNYRAEDTGYVFMFYPQENGFGELATADNGKFYDFPLPTREKAEQLIEFLQSILSTTK